MEHNPLGCGGNTVMTLVEGRQAGQNGVIVVSHHCCLFSLLLMLLLGAKGVRIQIGRWQTGYVLLGLSIGVVGKIGFSIFCKLSE